VFKEGIARMLKLDQVIERLTDYVESKIELVKYDLKEDAARIASRLSIYLIILFIGTFFLLFISIAIALEVSKNLGYFWGFGIVSGVYLMAGLTVFFMRNQLATKIEREIKILVKQKNK